MTHTEESLIARLRIPHHTCEPILREAAEALEKAEAENAWLKEAIGVRDAENQRAIDTLKAECERLRKDAERYRWVRGEIYYKPPGYDGRKVGRWVWDWDFVSENASDLDAAIDAALKDQP